MCGGRGVAMLTAVAVTLCAVMTSRAGASTSLARTPWAKRLYDEMLEKNRYDKLIRPVGNTSESLTVKIGLRLTSIIDVDEKNQIMTTNVWLEQSWYDIRLTWNPAHFGGVERLYVHPQDIWLPDLVLYNSADGNFTVKHQTKVTVHDDGLIVWKPPAIFKSLCPIDVEFFPFDEQRCTIKIGSWTYHEYAVKIIHKNLEENVDDKQTIEYGINLDNYQESTEWDLLAVKSRKYVKYYTCCSEPYADIKFNITIRRKTLFYAVNLILPCIVICSVTLLVFYLPAESGEKITMAITILNSLNIFLLLVVDINPPTSLATPLIGKFLLFTMVLVTSSIMLTIVVINIHFRSPSTHVMSPWVKGLFLKVLPRLLFMQRPQQPGVKDTKSSTRSDGSGDNSAPGGVRSLDVLREAASGRTRTGRRHSILPSNVMQAVIGVKFIADHVKQQDEENEVKQDWQFVSMVLDRLLFLLFTAVCLIGTFGIIIQAPTLYDDRVPIQTGK